MDDIIISALQRFTLKARTDLEREIREQLEGIYGWLADGTFAPADRYPALSSLNEARVTRRTLEQYAQDEREAGLKADEARARLIRESAFTWLNRLVAFKMLEVRKLLKTIISRITDSNAYLFWLADEHDPEARRLHDAGDSPINTMGEGPRHTAYRRFLLWQCGELAREVSVLFDPSALASRFCPRPGVLHELVAKLNAEELEQAWQPGNEETIGWIYQAFNTDEKDTVFKGFGKGKKVTAEQIAPASQIFTQRWIVRFLVENSLGRLWLEMHPDSSMRDSLAYLVPSEFETHSRSAKPLRDILFMDPATGSMHFGLIAFDLFRIMYKEELHHAGEAGWPEIPSVLSEAEIPGAIIRNNIHGIDIDMRAVQLSALALFLKARSLNPKAEFTDHNLACCNIENVTGGRLSGIIDGANVIDPIHKQILITMAERLRNSNSLGSLLRPERDLERLIDEERRKHERDTKRQMLPGMGESELLLDTPEKREQYFSELSDEIGRRLDEFVRHSQESGRDESHFVGEATKGLRFLRLVQQRYDVVATNPPYIHRRNQSACIAQFLDIEYSESKSDLYAAFIERCVDLADPLGKVAMITQQSFMFISSYKDLRKRLRKTIAIQAMAHLGPRAFAMVKGEKVNTTAFVFEKQPDERRREESVGTYFRLVKERNADAKRETLEVALSLLKARRSNPRIFHYTQKDFDAIPDKPWVYWISSGIRQVFRIPLKLEGVCPAIHGTATYDNKRFLRFWWEIGIAQIERCYRTYADFQNGKASFVPYMKGGSFQRWHGNQDYVLAVHNQGRALVAFLDFKRDSIRGQDFVFHRGVTWSDLTSGRFSARLSPGGFIFDVKGSSAFPENVNFVLGILNSSFANYALNLLNPTVSYQVGDLARLPVPVSSSSRLEKLVEQAIDLARADSVEDETTYDLIAPPDWRTGSEEVAAHHARLATIENEIDEEVYRLYSIGEEDRRAIEEELGQIEECGNDDENGISDEEDAGKSVTSAKSAMSREELARKWVSYAVGIVLGRFEVGEPNGLGRGEFSPDIVKRLRQLVQKDGLLANDPGQPRDLAGQVFVALEVMLGSEAAMEVAKIVGGNVEPVEALRSWLSGDFWKEHFSNKQYRKRPVYWPLQSPKKRYTVWLFHERLGMDTLFHLRTEIVETRLRLAERDIDDLRARADTDRKAAKERDRMRDFADDLRDFSTNLKAITERGYIPHIDDGVLLNAAPLHTLLPSWPDTRKAWQELEAGEYDWAQQAMEYRPDHVREKCRTNRSYAIAHGLETQENSGDNTSDPPRKGRRKKGGLRT